MALTLSDLRTRLNVRTGDPNGDFLTQSERDMILNDAARKVASDLYRNGTALLTDRKKIQLEPAVTEYALPDDLIGVQEVFWEDSNTRYEVEQRPLQSFQDIDRTGDRPIYYDVFGQTGEGLGRSSVTGNTEQTLATIDQTFDLRADYNLDTGELGLTGHDDLANVNKGDIVYNLTDGSSGEVHASSSTGVTVVLGGGKSNVTVPGDQIVIESGEKTLPILHVHPQPTQSSTTEVMVTGSYDLTSAVSNESMTTFTVSHNPTGTQVLPFQLYGIRVYGGVLSSFSYEGVRIKAPTDSGGADEFHLVQTFRRTSTDSMILKPQEDIRFRLYSVADALVPNPTLAYEFGWAKWWDAADTSTGSYELLKLKDNTPLVVYYARYPRRLTGDKDQFELPEIALEAALLHAEYEVHLKAEGGRNNMSSQAYALYEMELQKIQKFLRTRNIRGSRTVRNVMYG